MADNIIAKMMAGEDFDENAARIINRESAEAALNAAITPLPQFPAYVPEEQNRNVLIKGRWLERGGSAWFVSTAGTGKSIHSLQLSLSLVAGVEFGGLRPNVVEDRSNTVRPSETGEDRSNGVRPSETGPSKTPKMRIWICQTEDSPTRITIDREDIIAELSETQPDIDWREMANLVSFVDLGGKTGVEAIDALDRLLQAAKTTEIMPDILILNPFMAFVGGPVSDSTYVTPFLRGGEINYKKTIGLQGLITKHQIGLLVYHHTPKPPAPDQIKAWMEDGFAEYKGAGSSDITNWGRSFIMMYRHPKDRKKIVMVAGKNGSEIGWPQIGGTARYCIAWAGKSSPLNERALRHAWRELTPEELVEFSQDAAMEFENDVSACMTNAIEDMRGGSAYYSEDFEKRFCEKWKRAVVRAAWVRLTRRDNAEKMRYQIVMLDFARTRRKYIGFSEAIATVRKQSIEDRKVAEANHLAEQENAKVDAMYKAWEEGNASAKG